MAVGELHWNALSESTMPARNTDKRWPGSLVACGLVVCLLASLPAAAQQDEAEPQSVEASPQSVTVAAGAQYADSHAGQDWLLGKGYRDLWAEPIEVEVLDLESSGAGLSPVMRIGGLQTLGLALAGEDGRAYTFRSVDKRGLLVLPDGFRETGLEYIIQDQVSSSMPAADLVAAGLAKAAGILHADHRLVVMPDDPRLGEFREDFAGVLGTFYEHPTDGSFGSTEVLGDDEYLERRSAGSDFADSRAFLRARLLDLLIGDWDRHYGQWRWARMPGRERLQPIPEDRDQAFSRYDGLALIITRAGGGQMTDFQPGFPPVGRIAFNGSDFDRIVLTDIERAEWIEIATDMRADLDDRAIEAAVARLPEPYLALRGAELVDTLRARRDGLVDYAAEYYEYLAGQVDVHGTDRDESTVVEQFADGSVEVTMGFVDECAERTHFRRLFEPHETSEIRIYLAGGDDRVTVEGVGAGRIRVRVIGGPGTNLLEGPGHGSVEYYENLDGDGYTNKLTAEAARAAFSPMLGANFEIQVPGAPYRDWGTELAPVFVGRYHFDLGLALGGGIDLKQFGFGRVPWAARHRTRSARTRCC
jgi:hypothetical protein